jgi:hypothetical protein
MKFEIYIHDDMRMESDLYVESGYFCFRYCLFRQSQSKTFSLSPNMKFSQRRRAPLFAGCRRCKPAELNRAFHPLRLVRSDFFLHQIQLCGEILNLGPDPGCTDPEIALQVGQAPYTQRFSAELVY